MRDWTRACGRKACDARVLEAVGQVLGVNMNKLLTGERAPGSATLPTTAAALAAGVADRVAE